MDKEGSEQDNPTIFEIIKKNPEMTYNEASKVLEELKLKKEVGACITAGMKRDKDAMDVQQLKKRVKEEEGKEITELNIRIAELLQIDEAHQKQMGKLQVRLTEIEEVLKSKDYTKTHDYKFLVAENKKLHEEIDELKRGKKKLVNHIEGRVHRTRKAGM